MMKWLLVACAASSGCDVLRTTRRVTDRTLETVVDGARRITIDMRRHDGLVVATATWEAHCRRDVVDEVRTDSFGKVEWKKQPIASAEAICRAAAAGVELAVTLRSGRRFIGTTQDDGRLLVVLPGVEEAAGVTATVVAVPRSPATLR
jgi:hypothetical protein